MLPAGWMIALAATALLGRAAPEIAFVLAGLGVQVLGLLVIARERRH